MTTTRVTQNSSAYLSTRSLQKSLARLTKVQNQLASQRAVQQSSDDPAATAAAMQQTTRKAADTQYLKNVDYATGRLGIADNTLSAIVEQLQSVRNLAVRSQNGSMTSEALKALGDQVTADLGQVVDLYNTTYLGQSIFGGTMPDGQDVVDPTTLAYAGDDQAVRTRISSAATVDVAVSGTSIKADTVPALLQSLAANITSGSSSGVASDMTTLDTALSAITDMLSDVGARENRVTDTKYLVQTQVDDASVQISNNLDLDVPAAAVQMQQDEISYQAALAITAKTLTKSLVDYLS